MTTTTDLETKTPTRRGTSNGNARGSSANRRARRAWIMITFAADVPGFCRCYRCGRLLFNLDDHPDAPVNGFTHKILTDSGILLRMETVYPLTTDRIIPGAKGGTYRRNNIRPACAGCNSETGGALASHPGKRKA